MDRLMQAIAVAAALAIAGSASATSHQSAAPAFTEAEVRKVDKEAGKLTLKHGPIANLEMPPMTMVFRVKDASMLARVKTGDKVRFKAEKVQGAYTVTAIEPAKVP